MELIKYPKTFHLPFSPGLQNDDRLMPHVPFEGEQVIITEKMDGEGTTMYHDHIHARSLDSGHHPSRDWIKGFWSSIKYEIPDDMRICGENMYAEHSISYDNLESYFLGFSIWRGDVCLDWATTMEWFELLGITPVPVMFQGKYNSEHVEGLWEGMNPKTQEGYVVRFSRSFLRSEFSTSIGKFVRRGHVQTDQLWMLKEVVPNKLREK